LIIGDLSLPAALPPAVTFSAPADDAILDDAEVTATLQALFCEGAAAMRDTLPLVLGTTPPLSFGGVCRDWIQSIRSAPPGLLPGASRLASPPPFSLELLEADLGASSA
jgi:hypothetical protein